MSQFPPHFLTHFHFALSSLDHTGTSTHIHNTSQQTEFIEKKSLCLFGPFFGSIFVVYPFCAAAALVTQYFICVSEQRERKRTSGRQKLLQLKERIGNRRQNKMLIFYFILVSDNSITSRVKTIEKTQRCLKLNTYTRRYLGTITACPISIQ